MSELPDVTAEQWDAIRTRQLEQAQARENDLRRDLASARQRISTLEAALRDAGGCISGLVDYGAPEHTRTMGEVLQHINSALSHTQPDPRREAMERPTIVCLCGSTRFYKEFQRANYEETMAGKIVLSVGFYMHSSQDAHGETWGCTPKQKKALDALHFRKIEMADEVLVLNVGGYIGESTGRELAHAKSLGKMIRFLEPDALAALEGEEKHETT